MDLRAELSTLDEAARDAFVAAVGEDWRTAVLSDVDRALCTYGEKLALTPAQMSAADVANLRAVGLDDVAIHDAIQVVSYFSYINRIADAVHVDLEPEMTPYPDTERNV